MEDQAKILHQDKMMSLGRLAASVVHEINNPLAGVLNYCRLMLRIVNRGKLTSENLEKFIQYLTLVESETGRCSEIISSLLTFSRKSPAEFGPVDVKNLVERSVLLSQHKLDLSNIRVETELPEALPAINGDFNQLQQCLINLIFNAIDAMPTGGILRLSASADPPKGRLTLSVQDTGHGIPRENLPHIFEPFFTSKAEGYGVGLGLSTLYGIIQHHNGDVAVESTEGEGTTFFLQFPI
jgi:signal transduction histidine kinase